MLAKLKHNVPDDIQQLLPDAIELAKQKKIERIQKAMEEPVRKQYGTGLINMSTNTRDHQNPILYKTRPNLFQTTKRSPKIYKKGPYEI